MKNQYLKINLCDKPLLVLTGLSNTKYNLKYIIKLLLTVQIPLFYITHIYILKYNNKNIIFIYVLNTWVLKHCKQRFSSFLEKNNFYKLCLL